MQELSFPRLGRVLLALWPVVQLATICVEVRNEPSFCFVVAVVRGQSVYSVVCDSPVKRELSVELPEGRHRATQLLRWYKFVLMTRLGGCLSQWWWLRRAWAVLGKRRWLG